jgi:hypothetical protein
MKITIKRTKIRTFRNAMITTACASIFLLPSCTEDYDPIGNNKPATKLKVSPKYISFDGQGGTLSSDVVTNAPDLSVSNLPEWIQTAVVTDDKTGLSLTAKENETDEIRSGKVILTTVTGDTESSVDIQLVQAGKNARIFYDSFTGDALEQGWIATDKSKIKIGSGVLVIEGAANGIGNSLYYQASNGLVSQSLNGVGHVVTAYVDVKTDPNYEGGLKVYYNPENGDEFRFFFTMNTETRGSFYAFRFIGNNQAPMALGDAVPGSDMPAVPPVGERDEFMRIEFTNLARMPYWWQSEVNIYSLKTENGETKVLKKHFSRKFEIDGPKPQPGYFGVWGRFPSVTFRNFTLSAQYN